MCKFVFYLNLLVVILVAPKAVHMYMILLVIHIFKEFLIKY